MARKNLYLLLAIVGFLVPYSQFVPWIMQNGLNMKLFFEQMFANRISAFFVADVLVSAVVVCMFSARELKDAGAKRWLPLLAVLTVGVSLALPLLLYLREDRTQAATSSGS